MFSEGLRVVGAGLGRTGTYSLHLGIGRLLGTPCYHMFEVWKRPEHVPLWERIFDGGKPDWSELFRGYGATVGGPSSAFWRELMDANPDAVVVLSVRDTDEWWSSFSQTVAGVLRLHTEADATAGTTAGTHKARTVELGHIVTKRLITPNWSDEREAKAGYERHNDEVRATVPPDRLVEWRPQDGWGPLCAALGVDAPEESFPHRNARAELRSMTGLD